MLHVFSLLYLCILLLCLMYSHCYVYVFLLKFLCILIVMLHVFSLLCFMYSYCYVLCILIVMFYVFLLLCFMYSHCYVLCILIVMFYVFLLLYLCILIDKYVLFSILCQLAFSGYPDWCSSVLFLQLYGKCQGIPRKDGARHAHFQISYLCHSVVICVVICIVCVYFYTVLLPACDNPIAVNKYIIYHTS